MDMRGRRLSPRQRNWFTVMMSIPILVVCTKILVERTFFGAEQRYIAPAGLNVPMPASELSDEEREEQRRIERQAAAEAHRR
ncbi:hypothetical protein RI367_001038 [Sorochytrium milnesiophthora]